MSSSLNTVRNCWLGEWMYSALFLQWPQLRCHWARHPLNLQLALEWMTVCVSSVHFTHCCMCALGWVKRRAEILSSYYTWQHVTVAEHSQILHYSSYMKILEQHRITKEVCPRIQWTPLKDWGKNCSSLLHIVREHQNLVPVFFHVEMSRFFKDWFSSAAL